MDAVGNKMLSRSITVQQRVHLSARRKNPPHNLISHQLHAVWKLPFGVQPLARSVWHTNRSIPMSRTFRGKLDIDNLRRLVLVSIGLDNDRECGPRTRSTCLQQCLST
jgi:hypothetical protein